MGKPSDISWIVTDSMKRFIQEFPLTHPKNMADILPNSSSLAQDFIKHILICNPTKRPTISQVIDHPFLRSRKHDRDYKKCEKFDISFEFERKIKTPFGVRYMMFDELEGFQKEIIKHRILLTGFINQHCQIFRLILPEEVAKCICLFCN